MYTAGEAIVRMAALELECVARAALVARPLTPPGGVRSVICQIDLYALQGHIQVRRRHGRQVLDAPHPLSGCTNWPRLEKGKGKKRAAGVPAASVATAVDLGDKEGGAPGQAAQ
jgi:hypothetical protein